MRFHWGAFCQLFVNMVKMDLERNQGTLPAGRHSRRSLFVSLLMHAAHEFADRLHQQRQHTGRDDSQHGKCAEDREQTLL